MSKGKVYWTGIGLLLSLAACSVPFNYEINILDYAELSGTFTVGQGGISPNPKTVGPVEIRYTPDSRVNLTGATLDYKDGRRRTRTPALSLPPTLCPGSQQGVLKLSGSPGACLRSS